MIMHFNVSPGSLHGRIEKEVHEGPCNGLNVLMTVAEARACWEAGKITDCNIAFRRLATEFDFDIPACLAWYRDEAKRDEAWRKANNADAPDSMMTDPEANR